jgi:hypothetical protein
LRKGEAALPSETTNSQTFTSIVTKQAYGQFARMMVPLVSQRTSPLVLN